MKNFRLALLPSAIYLALINVPSVQAANHGELSKTEALERRIRELEERLERIDAATAFLKQPEQMNP